MTKSELARSVLPSNTYTESQRRIDAEEAASKQRDMDLEENEKGFSLKI